MDNNRLEISGDYWDITPQWWQNLVIYFVNQCTDEGIPHSWVELSKFLSNHYSARLETDIAGPSAIIFKKKCHVSLFLLRFS